MNDLGNFWVLATRVQEARGIDARIACLAVFLLGLQLAGMAQAFAKAGLPRWGVLIPIYNVVLLLKIAERPVWWLLLLLIPGVNIVVAVLVFIDFAKAFGKGVGFGWGLAFLGWVFFPILGFGDALYLPTLARDPANLSVVADYFPKINAGVIKRFLNLGVALHNNSQGRGIRLGSGRGSAITSNDLPELIPFGFHELYLSRTGLGDEAIDSLAAMSQLRILDISHTKFTRDGINRLKTRLPHTTIFG